MGGAAGGTGRGLPSRFLLPVLQGCATLSFPGLGAADSLPLLRQPPRAWRTALLLQVSPGITRSSSGESHDLGLPDGQARRARWAPGQSLCVPAAGLQGFKQGTSPPPPAGGGQKKKKKEVQKQAAGCVWPVGNNFVNPALKYNG